MSGSECDVCGGQSVGVAASSCGSVSFAYCKECLQAGAEPWGALVAYASGAGPGGEEYAEWFEGVIQNNLAHHGKTREEFDAEVQEAWDEYEAYLESEPVP